MVLCHSESASRPTSLIGSEPLLVVPRLSSRERRWGEWWSHTPPLHCSHPGLPPLACIVGAGSCVWWNQFSCASATGGRGECTQDHSIFYVESLVHSTTLEPRVMRVLWASWEKVFLTIQIPFVMSNFLTIWLVGCWWRNARIEIESIPASPWHSWPYGWAPASYCEPGCIYASCKCSKGCSLWLCMLLTRLLSKQLYLNNYLCFITYWFYRAWTKMFIRSCGLFQAWSILMVWNGCVRWYTVY